MKNPKSKKNNQTSLNRSRNFHPNFMMFDCLALLIHSDQRDVMNEAILFQNLYLSISFFIVTKILVKFFLFLLHYYDVVDHITSLTYSLFVFYLLEVWYLYNSKWLSIRQPSHIKMNQKNNKKVSCSWIV
jgi:hypothetical protein